MNKDTNTGAVWNQVRLDAVAATPWRNGGGTTRELLAWPAAADWRVRMSVAAIAQDGPFSQFDDVKRWFAVLAGAGVRLQIGEVVHALTASSPPFGFDGASAPNCELVAGPTEDFNLMLKKGCVGHMERVSGELVSEGRAGDLIAIYTGEADAVAWVGPDRTELAARTLAWQVLPAAAALRLESPNALWMEIEP